jgi:hypothetical protein
MPVILVTWKAGLRLIMVPGQPWAKEKEKKRIAIQAAWAKPKTLSAFTYRKYFVCLTLNVVNGKQ